MTLFEVGPPAPQDRVGLGYDGSQAQPVGAPRQRSQFVLQLLEAFLAWPFLASPKRPAQEVETFDTGIDYARFVRMQGESCFACPLA